MKLLCIFERSNVYHFEGFNQSPTTLDYQINLAYEIDVILGFGSKLINVAYGINVAL